MKNSSVDKERNKENYIDDKLKVVSLQGNNSNNPYKINIPRNKKFRAKDILRLHSNLIRSFIKGDIESNEAKTLSYLCSNYLEALGQCVLEEKIKKIEEQIGDKEL